MASGEFTINLDHPTSASNAPRYSGTRRNEFVGKVLDRYRERYRSNLESILPLLHGTADIPVKPDAGNLSRPSLINDFISTLDAIVLWGFIGLIKPRAIIEIGSGNSTKFMRHSISRHKLPTRLTSIDPHPRAEIDLLCDRIIRQPCEVVDTNVYEELFDGDILFLDGSHRCFMNSDVTVFFTEILPSLRPGVWVHIHDMFSPFDYPISWIDRFYNEQYLLDALIANEASTLSIELPVNYVSTDPELSAVLEPYWRGDPKLEPITYKGGCSFWLRKN